jgi:ankyrin repeat protein
MMKYLLNNHMKSTDINFKGKENVDTLGKGPLIKEMHHYTPLMLAIIGGDRNLECLKLLLHFKANPSLMDFDGNTLLHLCAIYNNNTILEYLLKNELSLNLYQRNNKGDTALSIATSNKNKEGI